MTTKGTTALTSILLAAADDKLILGHRDSDWTGLAPILEEDIAFSAFAQDDVAHAQALYEYAGKLVGRTADQLAFGRAPDEYRCAAIVEVPDEFDWATAIGRLFLCNHFHLLRYNRLAKSSDEKLAHLASRLAAEQQIAIEHVDDWIVRLGRGTDESRQRMQQALDHLSPLASSLFEPVEGQAELEREGFYPPLDREMFEIWSERVKAVADRANLSLNVAPPNPAEHGGRRGRHTAHFKALLDEMCEVYRIEPDAAW